MAAEPDSGPSSGPPPAKDKPGQGQSAEQANKPSNAEIKAQKQAEKAKRRAAAIAAKEAGAPASGGPAAAVTTETGSGSKGGKPKTEHKRSGSTASQGKGKSSAVPKPSTGGHRPTAVPPPPPQKPKEKDPRDDIPECFSHLPMAKRVPLSQADKDVHPAVLAVGQQMATFTIRDNIARLEATLLAFRKLIESYETPPGNAFSRHFVPHALNHQIEYLIECRPMCFAMGNAIRLLKAKVSQMDIDTSDEAAKKSLCESIDGFIQERIYFAEVIIARNAADLITDGDVVLTYGNPRLVRKALETAASDGVKFDVAVVDDPYDRTGTELAKSLSRHGLDVSYHPSLAGLTRHLQRATMVFLGAEAMFANGSLYGPAGTSDIAAAAASLKKRVIALCETINFDRDRLAVDSLTFNEIDPERCSEDSFRLLFDTTREKCIDLVVTEFEEDDGGSAPSRAILSILRKQEDPN